MNYQKAVSRFINLPDLVTIVISLLLISGCGSAKKAGTIGPTTLVAEGAEPQLISSRFSFTEGPATDKDGNVFFTDQPNNKIWKYDTNGELSVFMDSAGRSNGMYFDEKGNLITCADGKNELWSVSPQKNITVLVNEAEGKKLNGPNDLWIAPGGNIYITDPWYPRPYWTRTKKEQNTQGVYLLVKNQKNLVRVVDSLQQPNGIIGTPDGRYLYVADIKASKTFRYTIEKDGRLSQAFLFASMGSDGMTIDNRGNIYLTGNGVTVFDSRGNKLRHIPLPGWTANVTFGGKNRDVLFITAEKSVYTLKMNVRGAN